jgi:hypothetical protein
VRVIGLEPTRLAAPDPKSGMSTNFTIPAKFGFSYYEGANIKINIIYKLRNVTFFTIYFFVFLTLSLKPQNEQHKTIRSRKQRTISERIN